MKLAKFEIRVILKYYWKQDYKAYASAQRICEMEGEGIVSEHVAQQWFQHFNTGEANTKDLPHSGGPKLWDIENICRVLQENLQKSTHSCQKNLGHQKIPYITRLKHWKIKQKL